MARDRLGIAQKADQRASDAENQACLRGLARTDPRLDKKRIEREKRGLLKDAYSLGIESSRFPKVARRARPAALDQGRSRQGQDHAALWHRRRAGQVDNRIRLLLFLLNLPPTLALNSATATSSAGLIYQLVDQQPSLSSRMSVENTMRLEMSSSDRVNMWDALLEVFTGILADPASQSTLRWSSTRSTSALPTSSAS